MRVAGVWAARQDDLQPAVSGERGVPAEGHPVADEDVAHLSPARYEHINPYGRYSFEVVDMPPEGRLDLEQQPLPGFL